MYSIMILCAGLATRLYPITNYIPKYLYPINGIPFVDYQLRLLKQSGFDHVVLCVGKFGGIIREYVSHGSKWGLSVEYSYIDINNEGTANAIKKTRMYVDDDFFVMYGDSYLPVNYKKIQRKYELSGNKGSMTIYNNHDEQLHKNNVYYKNKMIIKYSKTENVLPMNYLDYGISIFNKKALDKVDDLCYTDLSVIHTNLIAEKQLLPFIIKSRFYEVGSLRGIQDFTKYVIRKKL